MRAYICLAQSMFGALVVMGWPQNLAAQQRTPEAIVRGYISAQEAIMQAGATAAAIGTATAFLTDSVVYEHPRAGARLVGRGVLAGGMESFLGAARKGTILIRHLTRAAGVVVVEEEVRFESLRDGQWVPNRRSQVTVFDFEGDRISRIVDFWQPH